MIDQNELLLVEFPNLDCDDVIIPGTVNLSFNIELFSIVDPKRVLVSNIGRAIVKKLSVKLGRNVIFDLDDFDMLACYLDLWKTESEKQNAVRKGIIHSGGCTVNCMKLYINASDKDSTDKQDKAIADTCGNNFIIPLDFEMLESMMLYYQSGRRHRLFYEITFNDYNQVIILSDVFTIKTRR